MSASAELVVLGAGSILPRAGYGCAGYALRPTPDGALTLFDCGPGSLRALGAAGLELGAVERVVLSHYHPDHCLDLFALFFARRNPNHEPRPLEVIGPAGLERIQSGAEQAFGGWVIVVLCVAFILMVNMLLVNLMTGVMVEKAAVTVQLPSPVTRV